MAWRRMDSLKLQSENIIARPSMKSTKSKSRTRQVAEPFTQPSVRGPKEEALDYIYDLPDFPLPIRKLTPLGRVYEIAKLLAAGLVVVDPLNLLDD